MGSVADLAGRVAMSRRNFERVFTRDRDYAITVRPMPLHWGLLPYARTSSPTPFITSTILREPTAGHRADLKR